MITSKDASSLCSLPRRGSSGRRVSGLDRDLRHRLRHLAIHLQDHRQQAQVSGIILAV